MMVHRITSTDPCGAEEEFTNIKQSNASWTDAYFLHSALHRVCDVLMQRKSANVANFIHLMETATLAAALTLLRT